MAGDKDKGKDEDKGKSRTRRVPEALAWGRLDISLEPGKAGEGDSGEAEERREESSSLFWPRKSFPSAPLRDGIKAGIKAGIKSGIKSGIKAGIKASIKAGIKASIEAGITAGITAGVCLPEAAAELLAMGWSCCCHRCRDPIPSAGGGQAQAQRGEGNGGFTASGPALWGRLLAGRGA